jgi:hypothetical protein
MGRDYTKIKAWQLADELALLVYKATKDFPRSEIWGLTSQMTTGCCISSSEYCRGFSPEEQERIPSVLVYCPIIFDRIELLHQARKRFRIPR